MVSPTLIYSPSSNGFSPTRNKPLIKLDADVCEANPMATDKTPAAPNSTPRLKPICRSAEAKNKDSTNQYNKRLNSVLRSEEHTSELQSRGHLVCRLLL